MDRNMRAVLSALVLVLIVIGTGPVVSHEFWIAPVRYAVEPGEKIVAALRVGENFKGSTNSFIPDNFSRFDLIIDTQTSKIEGRMGDDPALQIDAPKPGLAIIVHETTKNHVRYLEWEKFAKFARHKNFPEILETHKTRNLPDGNFLERYFRFAKSLVAVGHGRGKDRAVGLETEFVAEANPYTDKLENGLPVRLLFKGKPRANAQVEVFAKASNGTVDVFTLKTDRDGRVSVPTKAGHEYLLDAVVIRPLEAADPKSEPVWETLWAQFTFSIRP